MLAAAVVLLGSVDSAAAVVAVVRQEPAVRAPRVVVPLLVAAELRLLHLLPLRLPQVVVESEVTLHLKGRLSFSAAMARSSPPTVQPTYARAPSTR
jgi:hypothetical protein